jgi:multicomponent Na+:H+ antiporter subunit E
MPASPIPALRNESFAGWLAWLRRIALFAALWWILTDGAADSWWIGGPIVLLAAWLSHALWAPSPLSLVGLARFAPWFAWQSLVGATDVAMRAFQPRMPLRPGVVHYSLRLPPGAPRVALANVVSMLAGTLSVDLIGEQLVIHALDTGKDLHAMVVDLEPRIASVFACGLAPGGTRDIAS